MKNNIVYKLGLTFSDEILDHILDIGEAPTNWQSYDIIDEIYDLFDHPVDPGFKDIVKTGWEELITKVNDSTRVLVSEYDNKPDEDTEIEDRAKISEAIIQVIRSYKC